MPFWLAGGYADPERVAEARAAGAEGVQVGTAFAFCDESGYDDDLRRAALADVRAGASVRTDPFASPTGYPFKVLQMAGTLSDPAVTDERERRCDLGYLRELYERPDGRVGYRCPAEPVADFVAKGGTAEDTVGRQCLCNALVADIGLGQTRRDGYVEPPLVTAGDDLDLVAHLLERNGTGYTAAEVIDHLLPEGAPVTPAEVSGAVLPGAHARLVAVGVGEDPPRAGVAVLDQRAAGGERPPRRGPRRRRGGR